MSQQSLFDLGMKKQFCRHLNIKDSANIDILAKINSTVFISYC